jgi:hypothetical protein
MPFAPGSEVASNVSAVGLAHETVYNTAVAPTQFDPFTACSLNADPGLFYPQIMMGVREMEVFPLYGQEKVSGALESPFFPHNGVLAWVSAVGSDAYQSGSQPNTQKNGTISTAAANGGASQQLTYTVTNGTPAPVANDVFMVGPAAVGTFGSAALGTDLQPSFCFKVQSVSGSGPYTITTSSTEWPAGIPYAIATSGASKNNVAQLIASGVNASGGPGPYFHSVQPSGRPATANQPTLPASRSISLTVEKNLGGVESERFTGAMCNSFSFKIPTTNAEVSYSSDMIASGVSILSTPSTVAGNIDSAVPFVFPEGAVSLFGTSLNTVSNFSMQLNNTVKDTYTMGNNLPTFITPTTRTLSGQITVIFYSLDDPTYGYFKQAIPSLGTPTQGALSFTMTHAGTAGSLFVNLPFCNIAKITDEIRIGDVIMQTLDFKAAYSLSAGYLIQTYFSNAKTYLPY